MIPKLVKKKTLPQYYEAVIHRDKFFELRKDEDDIQACDGLVLQEWDGSAYTGREIGFLVRYVLRNAAEYGLMEGYCIIGWGV